METITEQLDKAVLLDCLYIKGIGNYGHCRYQSQVNALLKMSELRKKMKKREIYLK